MKKLIVLLAITVAALCMASIASAKRHPPPPPPPPPPPTEPTARFDATLPNRPAPGDVEFGISMSGFPVGVWPDTTVSCDNGFYELANPLPIYFVTGQGTNCTATLSTVENGQTLILATKSFTVPLVS